MIVIITMTKAITTTITAAKRLQEEVERFRQTITRSQDAARLVANTAAAFNC